MNDSVRIRGEDIPIQSLLNHWVCGCRAALKEKTSFTPRLTISVVCSADENHPQDTWVPKKAFEGKPKDQYQVWDRLRKESNAMAFVKDRHGEDGRILAPPRVRVAGRINLGEKTGGGARPVPYFIFKIYEKGAAEEALLQQVVAAVAQYAPGQENPLQPKVLPVFLPANSIELVAESEYKLAGKEGRPRCVGDGETIQFKLGNRNLVEIYEGRVAADSIEIDGEQYLEGDLVRCPGRNYKEHWTHCEKCRFTYEGKFQIAGLPYIFTLKTGDQLFYSQYFTVLEMMEGHVQQGHARFMSEIPLLLRRYEGEVFRPSDAPGGIQLTPQEMPLLSIEIHPLWLMQVEAPKTFALDGGMPMQLEEAPRKRIPAPQVAPEPEKPPKVTIHEDGLPGIPFGRLLGDWHDGPSSKESIIQNAVSHLGMTRESAEKAIAQYKDSVKGLKDLWTCLRQHVQAGMQPAAEPAESTPEEEPVEEQSPEQTGPPPLDDLDWMEVPQGELL